MKRLCVTLPNLDTARSIVNELHEVGMSSKHIHLLAREGTELDEVRNTTDIDESDFIPALERGLTMGGTTGLLAGLVALSIPGSVVVGGGALLVFTTLLGAGTAGYLTAIVGSDVPNTRLHKFREALEEGEIMLLFDVPKDKVEESKQWVLRHHPEAEILGVEPNMPMLPG